MKAPLTLNPTPINLDKGGKTWTTPRTALAVRATHARAVKTAQTAAVAKPPRHFGRARDLGLSPSMTRSDLNFGEQAIHPRSSANPLRGTS
jgi:hypothetical protein